MSYLPHQIEASDEMWPILQKYGVVACWGEPRSGKTATAIRTCELAPVNNIVVLTRKNAIEGWHSELTRTQPNKNYRVTNYEQAKNLNPDDYDLVILDESHALAKVGRPTQRVKDARKLAYNKPVILLTGTPAVEKEAGLYHQFAVTKYSPFRRLKNFYMFFRYYGIPHTIRINGNLIEQYDKCSKSLMEDLEPYVVKISQEDAGIKHRAIDRVHKVALDPGTHELLDAVMDDNVAIINGREYGFDSDMAVRAVVHQIESGAVLLEDEIVELPGREVIDYIGATFSGSVALMAHYRSTRMKLQKYLPHMHIYSSDAHSEGCDLSHHDEFVIVNSAYSGSKFVQRRERTSNINRKTQPIIHHIVTDGGISQNVYNALQDKNSYNLRLFRADRAEYSEANHQVPGEQRRVGG